MTTFIEMLRAKWNEDKFVCVGLDSDMTNPDFPADVPTHPWVKYHFSNNEDSRRQLSFNCWVIDATYDLVCAYKPNLAFYPGDAGKRVLMLTIAYSHSKAPDVPIILDAKQADIGNTNNGYVEEDFVFYGADAVTVHPYLGMEAMRPYLDRADKGIIVLVRTSNPGAGEFQDLQVYLDSDAYAETGASPLYQHVARHVATDWNYNGNCAVVVGATYPEELAQVRRIIGDMPILIPGIGAQGGDLEATVRAGRDSNNQGVIINSSRGIIFANSGEDFEDSVRTETMKLHYAIYACLTS